VTLLVILCGCAFVFCLGLVRVIWDLSEMSVHVSPHMSSTQCRSVGGAEEEHSNTIAKYESNPLELSQTE
jgi:hypothetical protein